MSAGQNLVDFNDELAETQANMQQVEGFVEAAVDKAKDVEDVLETFAVIADSADSIQSVLTSLKSASRLLEKVGPLRLVAQTLTKALDKMADAAKAVKTKAQQIDAKLEPLKQKATQAREKLEEYELGLEEAADELASYQASAQSVEDTLNFFGSGGAIIDGRLAPAYAGDSMLGVVRVIDFPKSSRDSITMTVAPLDDARLPERIRLSWFEPAVADGASLSALTVIVTVSVVTFVPSLTLTSNCRSLFVRPSGAVNVGLSADGSSRTTDGPDVCTHV